MNWHTHVGHALIAVSIIAVGVFIYLGILMVIEDRRKKKEWADHVARGFKKLQDRRKQLFEAERKEREKYDDRKPRR